MGGDPERQKQFARALEAADAEWEPLKESRDRRVLSLDLKESDGSPLPLILKVYQQRRGMRRLRDIVAGNFGGGPAAREWRALSSAHASGLPVPEPFAWARGEDESAAVFMRACGDCSLLDEIEATSQFERPAEREVLAQSIAKLVHTIHNAGFVHGDLHVGNLRVSHAASGPTTRCLDLQKFRRTTSERARLADWARLAFSLERMSGEDALVHAFHEASKRGADLDAARIAFLADHQRGRARRRLIASGGPLGRNKAVRIASPNDGQKSMLMGFRDRDIPAATLEAAMEPSDSMPVGAPRKDGRVEVHRVVVGERALIRKHTRRQGLRRSIADVFRGSPAARAFRRGQRDRLISDRAADALGFVERRRFGFPVESWLFLSEVGDHDLDHYVPRSPEEAESIALAVVRWLAAQHQRGPVSYTHLTLPTICSV